MVVWIPLHVIRIWMQLMMMVPVPTPKLIMTVKIIVLLQLMPVATVVEQ